MKTYNCTCYVLALCKQHNLRIERRAVEKISTCEGGSDVTLKELQREDLMF